MSEQPPDGHPSGDHGADRVEILPVPGIGEKMLAGLRDLVTV